MNQFEYKDFKFAVAVDLDQTLSIINNHPDIDPPREGAKEFLEKIRNMQGKIVIFTGRLNKDFAPTRQVVNYMKKKIVAYLNKHNLPFDEIADPKHGKPRVLCFIDDRNIGFRGSFNGIIDEIEKMYQDKVTAVRNPAIDQWLKIMKNPAKRKKHIEKLEQEDKND